jgi:superfamily I DNA/RNA helicase
MSKSSCYTALSPLNVNALLPNYCIIDLNENVIPYPAGFIDTDDEFHISTERRLLYTSMTRARERLYLLSSGIPSRYLSEIDINLLKKVSTEPSPEIKLNDLPF